MSGQKVTKSSKTVAAANGSVSAIMKKAFKKDTTWEDKVLHVQVCFRNYTTTMRPKGQKLLSD